MRLIDFLLRWYGHRAIQSFYKKGEIKVNGNPQPRNYQLVEDDYITVGTCFLVYKENHATHSD